MHWIKDMLLSSPMSSMASNELALEDKPDLVNAGHHREMSMGIFYGDRVAIGVESNQRQRVGGHLGHSSCVKRLSRQVKHRGAYFD